MLHPEVNLVGVLANDLRWKFNLFKQFSTPLSYLQFDVLSVRHLLLGLVDILEYRLSVHYILSAKYENVLLKYKLIRITSDHQELI